MILTDVNVLIYAHREEAESHEEYRAWLEGVLGGSSSFGKPDLVLSSGSEWITTDRDYAQFPGLRWRHPLTH